MIRITVFNVGQASSCLIDFGDSRIGIIDCGAGPLARNPIRDALIELIQQDPCTEVTFLLLTHLDWDHISGLEDLLLNAEISKRIRKIYCNTTEFRALWEVAKRTLVPGSGVASNPNSRRKLRALGSLVEVLRAAALRAQDFHFELVAPTGASPSTYPVKLEQTELNSEILFHLFAPSQALRDRVLSILSSLSEPTSDLSSLLGTLLESKADWNAASAVVALEYKGARILFGGDANAVTWREILKRLGEANSIESDVAIAWHHGARLGVIGGQDYDQTAWQKVLKQSPERHSSVLISHGCGRYGHPHSETVKAVTDNGGQIYCTQLRKKPSVEEVSVEELGGLGTGWDGADVEIIPIDNSNCCGNITVHISATEGIKVDCDGPRFSRALGSLESCCLAIEAK